MLDYFPDKESAQPQQPQAMEHHPSHGAQSHGNKVIREPLPPYKNNLTVSGYQSSRARTDAPGYFSGRHTRPPADRVPPSPWWFPHMKRRGSFPRGHRYGSAAARGSAIYEKILGVVGCWLFRTLSGFGISVSLAINACTRLTATALDLG